MGRPREFEHDEVLDRAMQVFSSRGYEATAIEQLVARMGIQRGSLYATFGDKRALFFAAIERSDRVVTSRLVASLDQTASGRAAIERFFRLKVEFATAPGRPRGCLMTNSAAELASRDGAAGHRVGAVLTKIEAAFHRAVVRGQRAGEIDRRRNVRALARFLTCGAQGLSVMAKTFPDRATSTTSSMSSWRLSTADERHSIPEPQSLRLRCLRDPVRRAFGHRALRVAVFQPGRRAWPNSGASSSCRTTIASVLDGSVGYKRAA